MNTTTKTIGSIILLAAAVITIAFIIKSGPAQAPQQNPPAQIGNADITVTNITQNATINLPLTLTGNVVGNWFFEGTFPVFIKDPAGNILGTGLASSTSDWMTPNVIPFSVTLPAVNYTGPATIVFHNDNASGEPQFDKSFTVSVIIQ